MDDSSLLMDDSSLYKAFAIFDGLRFTPWGVQV